MTAASSNSVISYNQLNDGISGSGRSSSRTPCAGRSAFQMTMVLSRRLLDFPDRERLGTTVNEHFSFLPLHSSRHQRLALRESKFAVASTPSGIPRTYGMAIETTVTTTAHNCR